MRSNLQKDPSPSLELRFFDDCLNRYHESSDRTFMGFSLTFFLVTVLLVGILTNLGIRLSLLMFVMILGLMFWTPKCKLSFMDGSREVVF